ncbi:transposase [Pseudarthrobacter sp. R1]|uniref:transposase n=1 Tax=Pseudarthrobacter sp. R1 TaxID=2944934 RepID=UPI00210E642F|nr:transposase [Pseudarthrobacter sp. R1]MCQ6272318.1 transposase [Pseudarthrobacter sp. R1]
MTTLRRQRRYSRSWSQQPHGPETNSFYRTVCRWWKEMEVLIITGATTGKGEANNTAIKNIKRTARGYRNPANYKSVFS